MEIGISGFGGFEGVNAAVSPPLPGMHLRSSNNLFGIVGNPQKNGWIGSAFDGDFFTPGSPENGWGFQIGSTGLAVGNNCTSLQQINGSITSWSQIGSYYSVDWEGDDTLGLGLHFKINYLMQDTALFYSTTVSITNNTSTTIPNLYYYKNMDPDNNEEIGGGFTTQNTIVGEPVVGNDIAFVSATQTTPWNSYIALIGFGANWRANYGGFSNRGAFDMWTGGITPTGTYIQTVGSVDTADQAISLAYLVQNLNPGETQTFYFNTVIDTSSIDAALNGLFFLDFIGEDNNSSIIPDTLKICGVDSVQISVNGTNVNNFNWTWSPSSGLSDSVGVSILAYPSSQTTYTVIGTPISGTSSPDTLLIVVETFPGFSLVANYSTSYGLICTSSSSISLSGGSPLGGMYSGAGVTSGNIFDPSLVTGGLNVITYTVSDSTGCSSSDTAAIFVNEAVATLPFLGVYCNTVAPFVLTLGSPVGGIYSGTGIVSDSIFDPSVLFPSSGIFPVTYSYTDSLGCVGSDVNNIQIGDCTGIATNDLNNNVLLYPNPFTNFTTINISNSIQVENADLFIYDMLGKEVMKLPTINEHEFKIERKNLESGIYFYKLENKNKIIASGKLIIY